MAAREALGRAVEARREVRAQGPDVEAVAARLREARMRNHFAESIRAALEGGAQ